MDTSLKNSGSVGRIFRRALFLDRDGVVNIDTGHPHRREDITFIEGIFDVCRLAKMKNYLLIVITNQAGIGRGMYGEEDFHALMQWMGERFAREGCAWDAYYFCPHHPEHGIGAYKTVCDCRKPKPGMLTRAAEEWAIDLGGSLLVGDRETDRDAAASAGIGHFFMAEGEKPLSRTLEFLQMQE